MSIIHGSSHASDRSTTHSRISAKTCASEILAYGNVEPGPSGHVFLTISKAEEGQSSETVPTWQAGMVS